MELLKVTADWIKAEIFSAKIILSLGVLFVIAGFGFWQLGKSLMARSFTQPMFTAGILIIILGMGLFFSNKSKLAKFEKTYAADPELLLQSEIERATKIKNEYELIAFKVFPALIALMAIAIMISHKPYVHAIAITVIIMLALLMAVDSNAKARIDNYLDYLMREK